MSPLLSPVQSPSVSAHADVVKTSALGTAVRYEWQLLRFDLGWWTAIILLLACMGYALGNGRIRLDHRARSIAEAKQDEKERLARLTRLLDRIERNEVKPPEAPYRDPGNAIYMGRGQAATVAYLPAAPFAMTAVGLSDLYPDVFKVSAGSKDSFLFVDDIANPSHLLSGSFDLAFVIVYVYPLLLLALSYDIRSGEQEQGTLALVAASSARLTTVLGGKLMVRAGGVVVAAVVGCWGLLFGMGARIDTLTALTALGLLSLAIVVYGLFWVALALVVNSLKRDSAFNAIALAMAWVLLLLVAPAAMNATAQVVYPSPPRAEMILAVRAAAIDAERDREATEACYREEHRAPSDPNQDTFGEKRRLTVDKASQHTLDVTLAADARADAILARQEAQVRAQRRVSDSLSFFVPPVLINDAIVELAGNGHTRWDDYIARVGEFHRRWQAFFVERSRLGATLTTADYRRFPRFDPSDSQSNWFGAGARRVLVMLGWLVAVTTVLLFWADRRLSLNM